MLRDMGVMGRDKLTLKVSLYIIFLLLIETFKVAKHLHVAMERTHIQHTLFDISTIYKEVFNFLWRCDVM